MPIDLYYILLLIQWSIVSCTTSLTFFIGGGGRFAKPRLKTCSISELSLKKQSNKNYKLNFSFALNRFCHTKHSYTK